MRILEERRRLALGWGRAVTIGLVGLPICISTAQAQWFGRNDEPIVVRRGFVRGPQAQYYVPQGVVVPRGGYVTQGGVIVPIDSPQRFRRGSDRASHQAAEQLRKAPPPPPVKGPLLIAISIADQKLTLYDDGVPIATSPVSTGTASHPTPMGVFAVIGKERFHRSNLYSAAPMPFMQRITWSGVALHAGVLPGYPASHGCIRLPSDFAIRLYHTTKMGARVIISPHTLSPAEIVHAHLFAPKSKPPVEPAVAAASEPAPPATAKPESKTDAAPVVAAVAAKPVAFEKNETAAAEVKPAEVAEKVPEAAAPNTDAAASPSSSEADQEIATANPPASPTAGEDQQKDDTLAVAAPEKAAEPVIATDEVAPKMDAPAAKIEEPGKENLAASAEAPAVKRDETMAKAEPAAVKPVEVAAVIDASAIKKEQPAASAAPATPIIAKLADLRPAVATPAAPRLLPPRLRAGAVSAFVSRKERRLYVRKGFEPLFDVPVEIANIDQPLGTHVFTLMELNGEKTRWSVVSMPAERPKTKKIAQLETRPSRHGKHQREKIVDVAVADAPPVTTAAEALDRIALPQNAVDAIDELLTVGASLIITDKDRGPETGEETDFVVLTR